MLKHLILTAAMTAALSTALTAQQLDGRPFDPARDPNPDTYMNNWHSSQPRTIRGNLVVQDVLTQGDPMNPPMKGAVMKYTSYFVHASLDPGMATSSTRLDGEQEVWYVTGGKGVISAGREKHDLYTGICMLVPANLAFTVSNSGTEPLEMYIVSDKVVEGFTPNKNILVKDDNVMPIQGSDWHWAHIGKDIMTRKDGLSTLYSVLTIRFDPMTISHPHSHDPGCEEVWTALRGTSTAFIGKQIRKQPPGTAYNIPPDSKTPHCNLNTSEEQAKLLYFSVRKDIDGTGL